MFRAITILLLIPFYCLAMPVEVLSLLELDGSESVYYVEGGKARYREALERSLPEGELIHSIAEGTALIAVSAFSPKPVDIVIETMAFALDEGGRGLILYQAQDRITRSVLKEMGLSRDLSPGDVSRCLKRWGFSVLHRERSTAYRSFETEDAMRDWLRQEKISTLELNGREEEFIERFIIKASDQAVIEESWIIYLNR